MSNDQQRGLERRIKRYDRYKSALKWSSMSTLAYIVLAHGPVPDWLAWDVQPIPVVAMTIVVMAAFGYVGMIVWQWMEPNEGALSAGEIENGE